MAALMGRMWIKVLSLFIARGTASLYSHLGRQFSIFLSFLGGVLESNQELIYIWILALSYTKGPSFPVCYEAKHSFGL